MANPMKELAEDLSKFLDTNKPKPVIKPSVTERHDVRQTARAVLEYVLQQAPENALVEDIGTGLAIGLRTAAEELDLKESELLKGVESVMSDVLKSARESLALKKK